MRCAQLVMGPAGTGKSTYCRTIQEHCQAENRVVHVCNLDPAAEDVGYQPAIDIRDLVTVADAMEEMGFGPNGGLVYCMEVLLQNMDWLEEQLDAFGEDDYLIFDCPGQIELYLHVPVMTLFCQQLQQWGFRVCGVYLIDSLFLADPAKFISGVMLSLSAMLQLSLPHINVLTKCDLASPELVERFLDPDADCLLDELVSQVPRSQRGLSAAITSLVQDFSMVSFLPMNINDEETVGLVLAHVDHSLQYGEDDEPRDRFPEEEDPQESS